MEKIIEYLEKAFRLSFITGVAGAFLVYVLQVLSIKSKSGQWKFSLVVLALQGVVGGLIGYFIGTAIPDTNDMKSIYIGATGALSFPVYLFLEKYGYDLLLKLADKFINKI